MWQTVGKYALAAVTFVLSEIAWQHRIKAGCMAALKQYMGDCVVEIRKEDEQAEEE